MGKRQQALLLLLNTLPLLHLASAVFLTLRYAQGLAMRTLVFVGVVYLLPPLVTRLLLGLRPVSARVIAPGTPDFFVWWTTLQTQMIFNRLPALEELLRLLPGVYSLWLRLWGARVGRLTFWSPGVRILDRPFLQIGGGVIFGAGARLNGHVLARNADTGALELLLAPIIIGDSVSVGGYSLLSAGVELPPGEVTRAFFIAPPFTRWRDGRRIRTVDDHDQPTARREQAYSIP